MNVFDQIVTCLDQLRRRAEEALAIEKPKTFNRYQVTCEAAVVHGNGVVAVEVAIVVRSKKTERLVGETVVTRSEGPAFFEVCVATLNSLDKELKSWRIATAKKFLQEALTKASQIKKEPEVEKPTHTQHVDDDRDTSNGAIDFRMMVYVDDDENVHHIDVPKNCFISFNPGEYECEKPN